MSGEDDLRAPCGRAEEHPSHPMPCDSGCQPNWHKDHCAIYGTCPGLLLLATPAEPARESDGVGLTEDERETLGSIRIAQGDLDAYGATWRVAEVVEQILRNRLQGGDLA